MAEDTKTETILLPPVCGAHRLSAVMMGNIHDRNEDGPVTDPVVVARYAAMIRGGAWKLEAKPKKG